MKDWKAKAAKRIVAESALRDALKQLEETHATGGPMTASSNYRYVVAMHLARHAAEQLRLSEGNE